MKEKPGVMIYFDMMDLLKQLNYRDKGMLFEAILEYAKDGTEPNLPEKLMLAWVMVRMRIDTDSSRYEKVAAKRKYAAYVRWARRNEQEPMSYEEWMEHHGFRMYETETQEFRIMHAIANCANAEK